MTTEAWRHPEEPEWVRSFERRMKTYIHRQIKLAVVQIINSLSNPNPAVALRLSIGGILPPTNTPVVLDVDVAGESANAQWVDDKNDVTTQVPDGPDGQPATIVYSSSDDTVTTVDPSSGALSFLKAGTATITATPSDSTGNALANFEAASVDLELTPGAAAGLEVSVQGAAPVPAPGA